MGRAFLTREKVVQSRGRFGVVCLFWCCRDLLSRVNDLSLSVADEHMRHEKAGLHLLP